MESDASDDISLVSSAVDVKIECVDDNQEVTVQSSVDYPTNPPGASTRDDSSAIDNDASDDISLVSSGVDVKIETIGDNQEVTAQSRVEYPTNPPGTSMRDGSGAMDDDASDVNGYALWDQDLQSEEEATPQENAIPKENVTTKQCVTQTGNATPKENAIPKENATPEENAKRVKNRHRCRYCHTLFKKSLNYDIHRLFCCVQLVPSVYACFRCHFISRSRDIVLRHLREAHEVPPKEKLERIQDLQIPRSDIVRLKISTYRNGAVRFLDVMKYFACDRCDFIDKGQEPIIRHLQMVHGLTLIETLSKYRELEVRGRKVETSEWPKRRRRRYFTGKKRRRRKTRQPEECSDADIVMDLHWNDTIQDGESPTDKEGNHRRVLPEELKLRTLSIKLQDVRKTKGYTRAVEPGGRRYRCHVCGKGFRWASSLSSHKILHSDFKMYLCEICGKNFPRKESLKVHMNWHDNIRDFVCDVCGKAFLLKSNLTKHYFTHTGKRPHPCTVCKQRFSDTSALRCHLLKKHGIHLELRAPRISSGVKMTELPQT
ncbi:uncharacterized protein [Diadema setosum]|uniref:uncharacterized protein n=1 Tax=Diadema setosum TaxID=31175 RepID=UPI003B3AC49E